MRTRTTRRPRTPKEAPDDLVVVGLVMRGRKVLGLRVYTRPAATESPNYGNGEPVSPKDGTTK